MSGIGECRRSSYKARKIASRVACIKFWFWKRASKSRLLWPWEFKEAEKRGWIFGGIFQSKSSFPSAGISSCWSNILFKNNLDLITCWLAMTTLSTWFYHYLEELESVMGIAFSLFKTINFFRQPCCDHLVHFGFCVRVCFTITYY